MAKDSPLTVLTATPPLQQASPSPTTTVISKSMPQTWLNEVESFFIRKGSTDLPLRDNQNSKDFHSDIFRSLLKINYVHRGRVSCFFSVLPPFINIFDGLHGGVIGSIAERIGIACARTVVPEEKELFLGELRLSYLSAAPLNEECVVDASMVKSGKNISLVGMEFRIRKTQKLLFIAQTTFFHTTPAVAKL